MLTSVLLRWFCIWFNMAAGFWLVTMAAGFWLVTKYQSKLSELIMGRQVISWNISLQVKYQLKQNMLVFISARSIQFYQAQPFGFNIYLQAFKVQLLYISTYTNPWTYRLSSVERKIYVKVKICNFMFVLYILYINTNQ